MYMEGFKKMEGTFKIPATFYFPFLWNCYNTGWQVTVCQKASEEYAITAVKETAVIDQGQGSIKIGF